MPRFKCNWPGCEYTTQYANSIQLHIRSHTNERPFVCDVSDCGKGFANELRLIQHKKALHKIGDIERCQWPGCEYTSVDKYRMREHMARHTMGGLYACEWPGCGQRLSRKRNLVDHMNAIHKKVKPYSCSVPGCQDRTAVHRNVALHMKNNHFR